MAALTHEKLARSFSRVGWTGLWLQIILAVIPIAMLVYVIIRKASGVQPGFAVTDYLAFVGLGILAFTIFWFFRYARAGDRIRNASRRPSRPSLMRMLWIGLWASSIGIVATLTLLIVEVSRLLFVLLKAPQGGVPVVRTQVDDRAAWISAIDVVGLLAELCALAGELLVLGFTIWLMYRVLQAGETYDQAPARPST